MSCIPFSSIVANVIYAMACTRSDLPHVIDLLSRFMSKPKEAQ